MDTFDRVNQLRAADEPFALATVVRCEKPTSARPGARAIVHADGRLEGWVGGDCAQSLVAREARAALGDGMSRLLRLSPNPSDLKATSPDVVVYPMTCHSGGALEIFIEPILPPPRLLVVGATPVAEAVVKQGELLGYRVRRVGSTADELDDWAELSAPTAIGDGVQSNSLATFLMAAYVVVAAMSADDDILVAAALRHGAAQVALVASRRRAEVLRQSLMAKGLTLELLGRLRAPAGLDLGGATPAEIALSIAAEMVQLRANGALDRPIPGVALARSPEPTQAIDPVCGMTVDLVGARHTAAYENMSYYFCCAGCQTRFEAEPARYLAVAR